MNFEQFHQQSQPNAFRVTEKFSRLYIQLFYSSQASYSGVNKDQLLSPIKKKKKKITALREYNMLWWL